MTDTDVLRQAALRTPADPWTLAGRELVSLAHPGALRAVLAAGFVLTACALTGVGAGAIIRHTAGAISGLAGVLFVLPLLLFALGNSVQNAAQKFLPDTMRNSLTAVRPVAHLLSPWLTFGVLCGYAMAALAAGAWVLARRDA